MRTGSARWLAAFPAVPVIAVAGGAGISADAGEGYTVTVLASGASMSHLVGTSREPLSNPDDITLMGGHVFTAFQDGVGPTGTASPTGNTDSTIVELSTGGALVHQWDVTGKVDGLTADPARGRLIATVNEDGNSSLYTVSPATDRVIHFTYSEPLPHNGGTDAISIYHGEILISASAPGTTGPSAPQPSYPAVYAVALDASTGVATVRPLYSDEATAMVANRNSSGYGSTVTLGLTDPDSNEVVPWMSPRFGGASCSTARATRSRSTAGIPPLPNPRSGCSTSPSRSMTRHGSRTSTAPSTPPTPRPTRSTRSAATSRWVTRSWR
jgi:hypothetical protein